MKQLFSYANEYVRRSDWKDLSMLKLCLFSMGAIAGCLVPEKRKKPLMIGCAALFTATYIPQMAKFFRVIRTAGSRE